MSSSNKIYLDYAATTPVDERVVQAMLPYFTQIFGNPSSLHFLGQQAEKALENARLTVANLLNASPQEIIFTSCGTESDNLALRGTALDRKEKFTCNHLLITPIEHHAVLHTAADLAEHFGFEVEFLPVDSFGMVAPEDVRQRLRKNTALVSVIYANNEIGTINPIAEIGAICQNAGIPFHTDAVQAAAHLPIDVKNEHIALLAIGAHKFYGPKGVGALYRNHALSVLPVQTGGGQETGLRAGTQNVPLIIGLAEAFRLTRQDLPERSRRFSEMRDTLIQAVTTIPGVQLTGHPSQRLPNHASFAIENVDGNNLLMLLDVAGFCCSSGSACKAGIPRPSEVLTALGLPARWTSGALRVTLGQHTTPEHIQRFTEFLPPIIHQARSLYHQSV